MMMRFWIIGLLALTWIGCDGGGGKTPGEDTTPPQDTRAPEDTPAPEDTIPDLGPDGPPTGDTIPDFGPEGPPPEDTTGDAVGPVGEGCTPQTQIGRFEVFNDPMGSWVSGTVSDAVSVYDLILQPTQTDGPCTLWMGLNPDFCDPQCVSGEECHEDGTCKPAPQRQSIGVVTVAGLKEPLELDANVQLEYKFWNFVGAPYEVGAAITLTASGDVIEGFELSGTGVPPLVMDDLEWTITPGAPLTLEWEPAEGPWEIWFQLNVDQHGLTPVTLRCTLPDTGSYTVSAEMIDHLITSGASGASKGRVHRRTIDSTQVDEGCVELEVFTWQQASPKCVDCPCTTPGLCPE